MSNFRLGFPVTVVRFVHRMSTVRTALRTSVEKLSPFNKVLMLGRVNSDPVVVDLPAGDAAEKRTRFELALLPERRLSPKDKQSTATALQYHKVWIRSPGLQRYVRNNVRKGTRVLVVGRLEFKLKKHADGIFVKMYSIAATGVYLQPDDSSLNSKNPKKNHDQSLEST